jgi:hypothetical protein
MPWPTTVGRGIASLLSRKGTKAGQKALSPKTQLRNAQSAKYWAQMNKKQHSDAFNKARARINGMKMPTADKDAAVDRLRTFYRKQHSESIVNYDQLIPPPVTPVSELVKQGLAFALGGGAGYGVAKNEEAIIEMLKSTKLPTGIDIETTSIGDLLGGGAGAAIGRRARGAGAGALGALLGPAAGLSLQDRAAALGEDLFPTEFDEVPEEPGLEEGSIGDLLLFNRILGD